MKNPIEIAPYNPIWPKLFEAEAFFIQKILKENCIAIHHIGSTSIPGLSAKPIIDILPVVKDVLLVDQASKAMESFGYEAMGECGVAFRRHFRKGRSSRTHNVHIYPENHPEIDRHLRFRDWLRTHKEDAQKYEELKKSLANQFPFDLLQYGEGKESFIASIDLKAGYSGWRMVQALTKNEWEAVYRLRAQCLVPNFLKDTIHFVFYKDSKIIGYAEIELQLTIGIVRLLVIEEVYRTQGHGAFFLKQCELWLIQKGFKDVSLKSVFI